METFSRSEIEIVLPSSGGHTIRGIRYIKIGGDKNNKLNKNSSIKEDTKEEEDKESPCKRWIFLHGWLDNAASFNRLIPALFASQGKDNIVDDVVAIDMSGHGKSDHRKTSYHIIDFVADTLQCADSLFGVNVPFNIMGHSLGAAVALMVAGTVRNRVKRLVMIDSLGPFTFQDPADGPSMLAKSLQKIPSGKYSTFRSLREASITRAEKNVVKDDYFTPDVAEVICSRGLRTVVAEEKRLQNASSSNDDDDGTLFTWSADSWLLVPTRQYQFNSVTSAFASSCTAETLILLAEDGLLDAFFRLPIPLIDPRWIIKRKFVVYLAKLLIYIFLSPVILWCSILSNHNYLRKLKNLQKKLFFIMNGLERVNKIENKTIVLFPSGGHHFHISKPNAVANKIEDWIIETSISTKDTTEKEKSTAGNFGYTNSKVR